MKKTERIAVWLTPEQIAWLKTKKNAINGGFYPKKDDWPAQVPSIVIAVDDIHESMKKVTEGGGQVLGEPMEISGIGQYVSFFDTEGNRVSILQPLPRQGR